MEDSAERWYLAVQALCLAFSSSYCFESTNFLTMCSLWGWACTDSNTVWAYKVSALRSSKVAAFQGFWLYVSLWRWLPWPSKVSTLSQIAAFHGCSQGRVPLYSFGTIHVATRKMQKSTKSQSWGPITDYEDDGQSKRNCPEECYTHKCRTWLHSNKGINTDNGIDPELKAQVA